MNLPRPSPTYSSDNETQTRNTIVQADKDNIKKNAIQASFYMVSPDGTKYIVTMANGGILTVTVV